jgi:hypothetical protein
LPPNPWPSSLFCQSFSLLTRPSSSPSSSCGCHPFFPANLVGFCIVVCSGQQDLHLLHLHNVVIYYPMQF